ncbi:MULTISPECIES: autoinducer binding domain-containing protein [Rhizobium]|nr:MULTISPECIES: autoinducer binding domain-containing protein [Rhizobium]MBB3285136.1 LuxR family quorum sensing-dependent transcriptional regulator [Rhizobium sp. BK252]MBB3399875.1 LuxR family quorum sensing-dependent transcriptional regulator [Rhizobium sp. BK289]MBB3412455.1 LuxR family quorum sensing-dependent transcriptional regulator [Rhizobium sp. BK284]MBB3480341.1 LuxR family quorum sensing-dependent transcriptional regulator [Rhizobium sp. BK347]MDK4719014.1 autoinducer binding dom
MKTHSSSPSAETMPAHLLEETTALITAMEAAQTEADILRLVLVYISRFGATNVLAGTMPPIGDTKRQQVGHILLNAWPTDWISRYFSNDYLRHDPTIDMVKEQHAPFFWRDIEGWRLQNTRARDVMGEAGEFGLREGFTIALQTFDGTVIGFSIGGEHLEIKEQERGGLQLLATFAVDRAFQLRDLDQLPLLKGVTPRERRALQLAADGLRDHEIAVRMGITHHGAEKHLRSVRDKLEAKNTTNAIAIAIRLGLIR